MKKVAALFALALGFVLYPAVWAQSSLVGKVSGGFAAPSSTDSDGRRHLVKGTSAESKGNGIFELSEPRVTRFNPDDSPDMFIESAQCTYHTKQGLAFSSTNLQVRTADGRFSIQGIGWRWELSGSLLVISNQVIATVQKAALAGTAGETNTVVRITAARFEQEGDAAAFVKDVLVRDGDDVLRCDRLNIQFAKPGGAQRIEAINHVDLLQRETRILAGRAVYQVKEGKIEISEKPRWTASSREGSADKLLIDRVAGSLAAEGEVFMKLPLTNLVVSAGGTNAVSTNRFVEIHSDRFDYTDRQSNRFAQAVYLGHVRAIQDEALLTCERLEASFGASNRLSRLKALESVAMTAGKNRVTGREALYDFDQGNVTMTGDPGWSLDQVTGRSEQLIFNPKTREILALKNVEMLVPGKSLGSVFLVNAGPTNGASTNTPLKITAQSLAHSDQVSVFQDDVVVRDARGTIECTRLTMLSGPTNQLKRVVAEQKVVLRQPDLVAFGDRAEYDAASGLVRLTGNPELLAPGKTLSADEFLIDRNRNTFTVSPGKYRIQLRLSKNQK